MKIVFLDVKTIGEDIDLSAYDELGEVVKYSFSSPEEVPARVTDADVIILNKVPVNEQTIGTAKNLKLVCVTATGTNNLDKEYLDSKGIAWRNVAGYSTETVAQHTFAMLLFLLEKLRYYDDYVKEERYVNDVSFTHFAGGIVRIFVEKKKGTEAEKKARTDRGLLFTSGMIAGEGIIGILLAVFAVVKIDSKIILPFHLPQVGSLVLYIALLVLLYVVCMKADKEK